MNALAESINDQVTAVVAKKPEYWMNLLTSMNAEQRIEWAKKLVAGRVEKGSSVVKSQFFVLCVFAQIRAAKLTNVYGSTIVYDFFDKMHNLLMNRLGDYGDKAFALSDEQFETAVRTIRHLEQ